MTVKQKIGRMLRRAPFYPHIYFFNHPFKAKEYSELVKGLKFDRQDVILDVGCGAGLQTLLFGRRALRIVGIDPNPLPVGRAISDHLECVPQIPAEFRVATIEEAKFAEGTFSKIFSVCVLEHIPDFMSALRECYRVLQPGGVLSFSCDSLETIDDPDLKDIHAKRFFVRHWFEGKALKQDLESIGFVNVRVYPIYTSDFAKHLFEKGIRGEFCYRYMKSIWLSWRLYWADLFSRRSKGIFLIVRANKPAE